VVDGVPIIGKDKLDKLLTKVCKEFSRKGVTVKPNDIHIPWDESAGRSKGYMHKSLYLGCNSHLHVDSFLFMEFRNIDEANLALAALHNHPFDAKHTFKLNRFSDIEKYANLDETYVEPEVEEFVPKV